MVLDYFEEHKRLFELIKDSAKVFEGAERTIEYLCNDYNVFCPLQPGGNTCKGIRQQNCPAYKTGMKLV